MIFVTLKTGTHSKKKPNAHIHMHTITVRDLFFGYANLHNKFSAKESKRKKKIYFLKTTTAAVAAAKATKVNKHNMYSTQYKHERSHTCRERERERERYHYLIIKHVTT